MDVNKNSYTFIFAFVMVLVVAALLSFAATALKPAQDENIRNEKMQRILASVNIEVEREAAQASYDKYITKAMVVKNNQVVEGMNAFEIDLSKEVTKEPTERNAPLYIADVDGSQYFIVPLRGKGLWGPIWGYMSLKEDVTTVYGAVFDHKSETPGLGAEISTPVFMDQFQEKKILKNGEFAGIKVTKKAAQGDYEVDGISGGTITSVGVENMIDDNMRAYIDFLKSYNTSAQSADAPVNKVATVE